eukprot:gene31088-38420_t
MAAKFRSLSPKKIQIWYDDGGDGVEQGYLSLGQETTTNTYNGHVFFFTEFGNRDNELARFTMDPDKVHYVIQDPAHPAPSQLRLQNDQEEAFMDEYLARTGLQWRHYYGPDGPRPPPVLHMWPADRVGDVHTVTSGEGQWLCQGSAAECQSTESVTLNLEVISERPRAFIIKDFLSAFECEEIIRLANPHMHHSIVGDVDTGAFESDTRTSRNMWVKRGTNKITESLFLRAADLLQVDETLLHRSANAEDMQVVHYVNGQKYDSHHDWGVSGYVESRFITLLLYLTDMESPTAGGETAFPKAADGLGFKKYYKDMTFPNLVPMVHTQHEEDRHAYCERWEDMVPDVDAMFEWALANRLNKIEWLLLGNYKWGDELDTKMRRLSTLTDLGHQYSLLVGADCPMGNIQQHGWHIVNVRLPFVQQVAQIEQRVDWIFTAGFDFLTTESGLSEFTHPECDLMVDLMNAFSMYVNVTWGREAGIKVHCSRGQKCTGYPDPRTGDPLNFNFLPTFAHPSMGVFPHTVQMYGLDDPTGGTYGNRDFGYMEDYLVYEAKKGERSVVFYGETAYWVNYDVDVPLFLPLYAQRRLHDLRRIAVREVREDFRIQGQMNFDSGWEWGYWLNDVVTARASWDPLLPERSFINSTTDRSRDPEVPTRGDIRDTCSDATHECSDPSLYSAADDQWAAYETSLKPVVKIFGPLYAQKVSDLLVRLTKAQEQLLIFGRVKGRPSADLTKLSGIAYMAGGDTWMDVPRMFGLAFTQPDKVYLRESEDPLWGDVLVLLREMHEVFGDISRSFQLLVAEMKGSQASRRVEDFHINAPAWKLLDEVDDCIQMLVLRAQQMRLLYDSRDPVIGADEAVKYDLQKQSRGVLHTAAQIVLRREENYRVAVERVGAWRDNPTVYRFGYLWSVHTLYY